ncbi:hypothetical protein [Paenibacillus bovis]|uniref:hypothetical protein n=1 Tax=Paenibacillus bovis TaxID=1616788 RepID=UPI0007621631|nr:hypothetical protein [Paenibacillus bovis]
MYNPEQYVQSHPQLKQSLMDLASWLTPDYESEGVHWLLGEAADYCYKAFRWMKRRGILIYMQMVLQSICCMTGCRLIQLCWMVRSRMKPECIARS